MNQATKEKPSGYILQEAPEAFLNVDTGIITETYRFDGTTIGFVIDAEGHDLRFEDITLILHKTVDNRLEHVYLDLMNLPGAVFRQIGAITGQPDEPVGDAEIVHLRLALLPEALAVAEHGLQTATAPGEFFDTAMPDGSPVLWDFHHWYTESLMGA
jgi:hypothetical protein